MGPTEENYGPRSSAIENMEVEASIQPPDQWSVLDVHEFVFNLPWCSEHAHKFLSHKIDGPALLLMKEEHFTKIMAMELGPALKLLAQINKLKEGCLP